MMWLENRTRAAPGHAAETAADGLGDGIGAGLTRRTFLGAMASVATLYSMQSWAAFARPTPPQTEVLALDESFVLVDGWVLPASYFRA